MSEPLTVKTSFNDISEIAQGYVNRVTAEQIILPTSAPMAEGEWLQFIVMLRDGTPAFAGVGRCIEVADRGRRADPEFRYELVLDSLRFEDDSRAVFEHLVIVREAMLGSRQQVEPSQLQPHNEREPEAPVEEELEAEAIALPEVEEQEQPLIDEPETEPDIEDILPDPEAEAPTESEVEPELAAADAEGEDDYLQQLDAGIRQSDERSEQQQLELEPEAAQPAYALEPPALSELALSERALDAPPAADDSADPLSQTILNRRAVDWSWHPKPSADIESYPSSGLFEYGSDALPIPASPPRPELDPSLWIQPAPRPSGATSSLSAGGDAGDTDALEATLPEPVDDIDGTVSQSEEGEVADVSDDPDRQ